MSIEGKLSIDMQHSSNEQNKVTIYSSRPVHASRVFKKKTPAQVLLLMPLLFNICGIAQAKTANQALTAALQVEADKRLQTAHDMLVLVETAREHLFRILIDWPRLFQLQERPTELGFLSQIIPRCQQALFADKAPFSLHSQLQLDTAALQTVLKELETQLESHVFGMPISEWQAFEQTQELHNWSHQHPQIAARAIARIEQQNWAHQGHSACQPLPQLNDPDLSECLQADDADAFIATPEWQGRTFETSVLSRQQHHPLILCLQQDYANGLMSRSCARLLELASIPQRLRDYAQSLQADVKPASIPLAGESGTGLAQTEAARGRLVHRVQLQDDEVAQYQILAPTEWNFHPEGLIKNSLSNLQVANRQELEQLAHATINSIDPCVGYELSIS